MIEKNIDFNTTVERRNTKSLKYDFAKQRGIPEENLPMWVADMDFRISSFVEEALVNQAHHGIYGYTETDDSYFDAVAAWLYKRHNYLVEKEWLVKTPGVVFAIAMAIQALTNEQDGVLIQPPVYYPFREVIESNGRRVVNNPLIRDETGRYLIDYNEFENQIVSENVKLFILCNPHNPVGRAWSKEELLIIGRICLKHNVYVVSDEIHSDFVYEKQHNVLAGILPELENITITCTSPSKSFNIAGLQVSNIFIKNRDIREKISNRITASGYSQLTSTGVVACEAAYRYGEEWFDAVKEYIYSNVLYTRKFINKNINGINVADQEATYLVWLDCTRLNLSEEELNNLFINKAHLWLDSGDIFGKEGKGFQRINVACPRAVLKTALENIKRAVDAID